MSTGLENPIRPYSPVRFGSVLPGSAATVVIRSHVDDRHRCAPLVSGQIRCGQQAAYQPLGKGINGQASPLSLAALGTRAFEDGKWVKKTFRSAASSITISDNPLNSARMGITLLLAAYSRSTPHIPVFPTIRRKSRSPNYDRRVPRTLALRAIVSGGTDI